MKTIKTILHHYRFDISDKDQEKQYKDLCRELRTIGLTLFDGISMNQFSKSFNEYHATIASLDGKEIELETDCLFNNQWNTVPINGSKNGLRVFDWSSEIYLNKKIKEGHWLEQTDQMIDLRKDTCKCGYCGKNYYKPKQDFCSQCLDSEYLTIDNLPLLYLVPISDENKRNYKIPVPEKLVTAWQESQRIARSKRNEKHKVDKLASLKKDIDNAQTEFDAFQWLIDHDVDFDNVIFYDHIKTFSFGWRKPLTDSEKDILEIVLKDFPYTWQFNKK